MLNCWDFQAVRSGRALIFCPVPTCAHFAGEEPEVPTAPVHPVNSGS